LFEPIPPSLNCRNEILPSDFYKTTAKAFHDEKFPNQDLYNDPVIHRQAKAMPSYKVNYIADVVEKVCLFKFQSVLQVFAFVNVSFAS
jgi:hypothetical protein